MPQSEYRARQVAAKTHEVFEYDRDDEKPGKPLHILIPGGLIALAVLALIIFIAYQTWLTGQLTQNMGLTLIIILSPFYVGGVFLFSYGYELYDLPRAIRLTAIIVFVTVASVVIIAVLLLLLGNLKGGSNLLSDKSSKKSSSRSRGSSKPSTQRMSGSDGRASNSGGFGAGNIFIGGVGGPTRVETREVTKAVVKEVPKEPMPITCPFCTRSYIPVEYNYICPSCGAATPKDLIEESQMPKE